MLHLFIDRALPQLLFQSPASCWRLIRLIGEEEQGARPRAVTGGAGREHRACLPTELPFLSPEHPAIDQLLEPLDRPWSMIL